ncbi:MAG TPA: helix-turn-helix domain-containing protein [Terriglobales bacterium]|nr:helix-turn-helix domain-containing protein [Terriglobales bacterium]
MKTKGAKSGLPAAVVELREQLGLNQRDFADKFGVSAMAVSRWESGANDPPGKCIVQMAKMAKSPGAYWGFLGALGLTKRDFRGK